MFSNLNERDRRVSAEQMRRCRNARRHAAKGKTMSQQTYRTALIVGAGSGLSASLARTFTRAGMAVGLAARTTDDLRDSAAEIGAKLFACDATDRGEVKRLFAAATE